MGKTGIYELDLTNLGFIHAIKFNMADLEQYVDTIDNAKILVDIIYEEAE